MTEFTDITYETDKGPAWSTIHRPERYNAFRARTLEEVIRAFTWARASSGVGVICLTGAGDKAFCRGGERKQCAETGDYGPSETGLFEVDTIAADSAVSGQNSPRVGSFDAGFGTGYLARAVGEKRAPEFAAYCGN